MNNSNTQLPVEWRNKIDKEAEEAARWQFHPEYSRDANTACQICYRAGATAYATKLHQLQRENEELKRWKMEAVDLLTPINAYAHKHLEVNLGDSCTRVVLAELDRLRTDSIINDAAVSELNAQNNEAKALLNEVFQKRETGLLPDRFIYEKIKKFLYGEE